MLPINLPNKVVDSNKSNSIWQNFIKNTEQNRKEDQEKNRQFSKDIFLKSFVDEKSSFRQYVKQIKNKKEFEEGQFSQIIGVDCVRFNTSNATWMCDLSYKIWQHYDDEAYINQLMESKHVSKQDKILFLCQYGYSSASLAFILQNYGYKTAYIDLYEFANPEIFFVDQVDNNAFLIDELIADQHQYLYFVFNQDDKLFLIDCGQAFLYNWSCKDHLSPVVLYEEAKEPILFSNDPNDMDLMASPLQLAMNYQVIEEKEWLHNSLDLLHSHRIACDNKFHCFLTRHYLLSQGINAINKLYCRNCN